MSRRTIHDPGALRHRLTLESSVETVNDTGHVERNWLPVAVVWASITPVAERSFEQAQQVEEQHTHRITLRYRTDVESGWRLTAGDRVFEILTIVDPDERRAYLTCIVKEQGR